MCGTTKPHSAAAPCPFGVGCWFKHECKCAHSAEDKAHWAAKKQAIVEIRRLKEEEKQARLAGNKARAQHTKERAQRTHKSTASTENTGEPRSNAHSGHKTTLFVRKTQPINAPCAPTAHQRATNLRNAVLNKKPIGTQQKATYSYAPAAISKVPATLKQAPAASTTTVPATSNQALAAYNTTADTTAPTTTADTTAQQQQQTVSDKTCTAQQLIDEFDAFNEEHQKSISNIQSPTNTPTAIIGCAIITHAEEPNKKEYKFKVPPGYDWTPDDNLYLNLGLFNRGAAN